MTLNSNRKNGDRWVKAVVTTTVLVALMVLSAPADAKITLTQKIGEKEVQLKIYGYSQLEMRGGDGYTEEGGPFFRAQRIRMGFNYSHGPIAGKLLLDFNQSFTSTEGGLPKAIKDAFVAYTFSNAAFVRLGMMKTPVGQSFTTPGWNLDNLERTHLDKGLVLERDFGVMLSGRLIGQEKYEGKKQYHLHGLELGAERQGYGWGYDIGVFNPAGRSDAVIWDTDVIGDALAYATRFHYDYGQAFHAEASWGMSEQAGGLETEDYSVFGLAVASELWDYGIEWKLEYLDGSNIRGIDGWDQQTLSATFGYMLTERIELVAKTYQSAAQQIGTEDSDLGNTYIGFNWFLAPITTKHRDLQRHKITVNYIVTNADEETWAGLGGLTDNAWAIGWQYMF